MTQLSEEQLETLLGWSSALIAVVNDDGQVLYVTPSSERLLGYQPDEFTGEVFSEHLHPDDEGAVTEAFQRFRAEDGTVHARTDYRLADADGEWTWFELESVRSAGSSLDGFVVVSRPVADRKECERTVERLAVVNRVLRHDLRNDVHVILNWLDGLTTVAEHEGDEETPMERIRNAGLHMTELTEEARDYEQAILADDAGEPEQLGPIVESVLEQRREMYPNATFTLGDVPSTKVRVPEMLDSVFRNLLNNAVQHNDSDEPRVEITFENRDDAVEVRVADDGPGLSDDRKESLFPDDRTELDSTETGVGLTIVNQVVRSVGGDVWVEDNDPTGCVFVVSLPKAEESYVDQLLD